MLIASRNSFLAGGKLTAKSYVQDGLIAMWDGIENAGWGVHDPNATTWKNLVTGVDSTVPVPSSTLPTCLADGWSFDGSRQGFSQDALSTVLHIESVYKLNKDQTATIILPSIASGVQLVVCYVDNQTVIPITYTGTASVAAGTLGVRHSVSVDSVHGRALVDGRAVPILNPSPNGWGYNYSGRCSIACYGVSNFHQNSSYIDGDIYNIRIYSRALTAAEVAANYAVDKARFNLS